MNRERRGSQPCGYLVVMCDVAGVLHAAGFCVLCLGSFRWGLEIQGEMQVPPVASSLQNTSLVVELQTRSYCSTFVWYCIVTDHVSGQVIDFSFGVCIFRCIWDSKCFSGSIHTHTHTPTESHNKPEIRAHENGMCEEGNKKSAPRDSSCLSCRVCLCSAM